MEKKRVLEQLLEDFGSRIDAEPVSKTEFEERVSQLSSDVTDMRGLRLAFDCMRRDNAATSQLKHMLESLAETVGRDLVRDEDLKAELCQQTYVLLLYGSARRERGYLLTYGGLAPLEAWLRTALVRHSVAAKRRHQREQPIEAAIEMLTCDDRGANPELALLKQKYAHNFRIAFRKSVDTLSAQDRLVLRHHLVDKLNAEEIGRRFRVHRVTIARWMRRIRLTLLEQTQAHLRLTLGSEVEDLNAVYRLVESQIYVSFSGLKSSVTQSLQVAAAAS